MVGYIYPQWHQARRDLIQAIAVKLGATRTLEISPIIDAWLRNHIFEFGASVEVSHEELYHSRKNELLEHERRLVVYKLLDAILQKDLFIRELNAKGQFSDKITYTILVFGSPVYGVGPGTREAQEVP